MKQRSRNELIERKIIHVLRHVEDNRTWTTPTIYKCELGHRTYYTPCQVCIALEQRLLTPKGIER